jgi:cytochrome c oxidase assembly protein subunit 15
MEQTHRYLAAIVTLLVASTALLARRSRRSSVTRPALVAVGIIVVQIGLGALTVMAGNGPPTVAAHLLTGLSLLGCTTVTATCALVPRRPTVGPRLDRRTWLTLGAAALLLASGSLIVNADAQAACPRFPLCPADGPDEPVVVHLAHRTMVALTTLALALLVVRAWTTWPRSTAVRVLGGGVVVLVTATASLGVLSALHRAPPTLQDLHLAGAASVLVSLVALATVGWLTGADVPTIEPADDHTSA